MLAVAMTRSRPSELRSNAPIIALERRVGDTGMRGMTNAIGTLQVLPGLGKTPRSTKAILALTTSYCYVSAEVSKVRRAWLVQQCIDHGERRTRLWGEGFPEEGT